MRNAVGWSSETRPPRMRPSERELKRVTSGSGCSCQMKLLLEIVCLVLERGLRHVESFDRFDDHDYADVTKGASGTGSLVVET